MYSCCENNIRASQLVWALKRCAHAHVAAILSSAREHDHIQWPQYPVTVSEVNRLPTVGCQRSFPEGLCLCLEGEGGVSLSFIGEAASRADYSLLLRFELARACARTTGCA
jgi:hypothetical protein